ncbi:MULTISPECIES: potassium-transporting ATPase subunit KdpB [Brevibacillus]|jgi:K+-transporting ATPase, B subunit|uniref:Potassium-transporting ATPase ATP-binding subunit n=1 Tax=Brevibacillus parabrevis TaxID=54914 RepID=A0A4Y3PRY8_BREPA|nr:MULTISPECIES: potassium-transporting ATPase subunit KdpB [Brevibacillus]MBU8715766.1 potassium-transporting ATPase subunit KdpB [Brevibacillus parabrevis]MDR5001653.1 potassium-transporting ATPase subunit KdpB [Brevibacillus parabrevis]RNB92199.1 K(+)-transporting ATPase subunit B [Brevibacillus parabrevis]GEB33869.1 potassium-transporting ATPase ATP-binding subunit [Brevibacillus parabrevis]HBZ82168.1 K(+)-transporting ATPase subunit B [Brevibacillus sp.]
MSRTRTVAFPKDLYQRAFVEALKKLDPRVMIKNPVMFVVEVGFVVTLLLTILPDLFGGASDRGYNGIVSLILFVTILFANFAEALAEGRGKAQAESLKKTKQDTKARKLAKDGSIQMVSSTELRKGDLVIVEAGELIPSDGEIVEGVASVDESAITGESAPVIKEAGGDFSSVTGGTRVVSDRIRVRVTTDPGESFLDRMISLVEGAKRQKTPNEIALNTLLVSLTLIFLIVCTTLQPIASYVNAAIPIATLVALLVCLIPTTIGGLLSAIGIAGMDRVTQFNVIAMSGKAVEASGDINTIILDKTGTITHGNRMAAEFVPVGNSKADALNRAAAQSSILDETPEGRSIVELAKKQGLAASELELPGAEGVEFRAETRMSGTNLANGTQIRKGAVDAIKTYVKELGGRIPADLDEKANRIATAGGTPLAVVEGNVILGLIYLKDTVKPGMRERFEELRRMGIRTVMCTGDNPLTAATIAREAGVDDFVAEAKPEDKIALIRKEQAAGKLVAMTGDGTNDAPALAQADVGLAMNSGTVAAKEAANMVDLDSDPTKIIEVVAIGKQLLMTRGALTTFSIANDVAKYFAIIPAMFMLAIPQMNALNIMGLATPQSAILSALIFNAIIIPILIPLAMKGVKYSPMSATKLLSRNLVIYGLGGILVPFVGIKLIDLVLVGLNLV